MEVIEAIQNRRSIREFKDEDISDELIEDILNCGRLAPSAKNRQPWYFIVLKNDVQSQKIVFINVKNGELVAMGDTIEEAKAEYDKLLADSGNAVVESIKIEGIVERIRDLGDQIEFIIKDYKDKYFVVAPSVSIDARFIQVGDNVSITCNDYGTYYYVLELVKR